MKKALLVVDYTYDFVATDEKLTCSEPGQALDPFRLGVIAAVASLSLQKTFAADASFAQINNAAGF